MAEADKGGGFQIPEHHDDPPNDPPQTTNTTNTSTGTSSGGSSGPADPYDKWYSDLPGVERKRVSMYDSIYQDLWGEPAPLPVLQQAVSQGLNTEEFRIAQMHNPAWWDTPYAKDAAEPLDNFLVALGLDPVYTRHHKGKGGKGGGKGDGKGGKGPFGVKPGDLQPPDHKGPRDDFPVTDQEPHHPNKPKKHPWDLPDWGL
jgi:hypothetical protein